MFVFYDDVQYDKHGWRNRNQIKTPDGLRWLTIPVHAKGNTLNRTPICDIRIDWTEDWAHTHKQRLRQAYAKAPHFRENDAFLESLYADKMELLADYTIETTMRLAQLLGIRSTEFVRSSTLGVQGAKTDRLLDTLRRVGATRYISGPSAATYIQANQFFENGISLEYIDYQYRPYEQLYPPFTDKVTILDLIFMRGLESNQYLLPVPGTGAL